MEPVAIAPSERHVVDYQADMYACVTSLEKLERANHRDLIGGEQYQAALARLLEKFHSIEAQLKAAHGARYVDVERFMEDYDMSSSCAAAKARLHAAAETVREKGKKADDGPAVNPRSVMEAAQHFITCMDCLKLGQTAADQLHPNLSDLLATVRRVKPDFTPLPRLQGWLDKLDTMGASEQLSDSETRDMLFDLDRAYQSFYAFLRDISDGPVAAPNP